MTADRLWLVLIGLVSLLVVVTALYFVYGPRVAGAVGPAALDVSRLPALNAGLNATTAALLVAAFASIRSRRREWSRRVAIHRSLNLAAFATGTLFLVSYLIYHWLKTAPRAYTGAVPALYYPILISHIVLAACIVPLALLTLYRGWRAQRGAAETVATHRRIARVTLPLWLYVSVTGVVVYLMLDLPL